MAMTTADLIAFLRQDVAPALGCTEPVCVALCAATAASCMTGPVASVQAEVNAGLYKNGMSAGIPNFDRVGLPYAAALGALLGNPEKSLELLEDVTPAIGREAAAMVDAQRVAVRLDSAQTGLYVRCTLQGAEETCTCVIRQAHTHVVLIERNGTRLLERQAAADSGDNGFAGALMQLTIAEIRQLVDAAEEDELAFLLDGVTMNERLAAYSENRDVGVGVARALRSVKGGALLADDLMTRIQILVAAAAENRLDGCPWPTMSSSGAGTKGLVVILPISETAKAVGATREATVKALAFGHCVNRLINAHIGKLAPMCTCAMASSTAASAAMTWLLGGSDEQIGHAIRNMTGTITGMICDGGKVGCALKVAMSSAAALLCALTAVQGAALRPTDGVCAQTPEDCIRNIARIANPGMLAADQEILGIMLEKQREEDVVAAET